MKENGSTGKVLERARNVFTGRKRRDRENIRRTAVFILNSPVLVERSGIWWTENLKPVFPPRLENIGAQTRSEPIKPTTEEDISKDDPRASIYVQGRFDADPKGDIIFSTRRVLSSVFRVLDKPRPDKVTS